MKTKRINVRVSEKEKEALAVASEKLDLPEATIVRQAVKDKIHELIADQNKKELALSN